MMAAPPKGDKGSTSPEGPALSKVNAQSFSIVKQASKLSSSPSAKFASHRSQQQNNCNKTYPNIDRNETSTSQKNHVARVAANKTPDYRGEDIRSSSSTKNASLAGRPQQRPSSRGPTTRTTQSRTKNSMASDARLHKLIRNYRAENDRCTKKINELKSQLAGNYEISTNQKEPTEP